MAQSDTPRSLHRLAGAPSPSISVVEAIADAEGVDPIDLDFTLNDHIDLDALDALVEGSRDLVITFSVREYDVTVRGGDVSIQRHR